MIATNVSGLVLETSIRMYKCDLVCHKIFSVKFSDAAYEISADLEKDFQDKIEYVLDKTIYDDSKSASGIIESFVTDQDMSVKELRNA